MNELGYPTLKERVYHRLRDLIVSGSIPLGSQIDEREVAERLAISRTPLREAMGTLVKEGLIEYRPYRGNFVRFFTTKQVSDLYKVRKSLEGLAIRLAVPKLSDEHIDALAHILDEVEARLKQGDMEGFGIADRRFHDAIARFSENETLIELLDRLGLQIQVVRTIANQDPGVVERTLRERPQILAALKARDVEAAARLMEEHIEGVRQAVVAQVEAYERERGRMG